MAYFKTFQIKYAARQIYQTDKYKWAKVVCET